MKVNPNPNHQTTLSRGRRDTWCRRCFSPAPTKEGFSMSKQSTGSQELRENSRAEGRRAGEQDNSGSDNVTAPKKQDAEDQRGQGGRGV
eukprot:135856-Hanusia_phi.AAC.1